MTDLLPCPFCDDPRQAEIGGSLLGTARQLQTTESVWQYRVAHNCGAKGPLARTEQEAVDAWNRRAPDLRVAELEAEVARLNIAMVNAEKNYLALHTAAYDVWIWFRVAHPDLMGPRAMRLGQEVNGPRPYGTAEAIDADLAMKEGWE